MHLNLEEEVQRAVNHPLRIDTCFVCGARLDQSTSTREHVLPRWLQDEFGLRDITLVLLNGTRIPYRGITIPCCRHCNGTHLSQLESAIRVAVSKGFIGVSDLPEPLLYQWLAKIYIGILYKELFLPVRRTDPKGGRIVGPDDFRNVRVLWFWLRQSMLHDCPAQCPGSVWIFRCLVPPPSLGGPFDLRDFHNPPTFGIRMGDIGLIVDFLDCGLLKKKMAPVSLDLQRLRLSPEQFTEVFARLSYKASTFGLHVNVRAGVNDEGREVIGFFPESTVQGDDDFWTWDEDKYAELLAFHMGLEKQELILPDGTARSWVYDADGRQLRQYEYLGDT